MQRYFYVIQWKYNNCLLLTNKYEGKQLLSTSIVRLLLS